MDATEPTAPAFDRATASGVGVALLVLAAVGLSATVGAAVLTATPPSAPATAAFDLRVTDATLTVTHRGGDAVDVRDLRLVVAVDGDLLHHQPPVPFFAARGFRSGPTGPFNRASDPAWTAGETATLGVASTNRPRIDPGDPVRVTLYVGDHRLAVLRATAS